MSNNLDIMPLQTFSQRNPVGSSIHVAQIVSYLHLLSETFFLVAVAPGEKKSEFIPLILHLWVSP